MKNTVLVIMLLLASLVAFAQQAPKATTPLSDNEFIEQVYYPASVLLYSQDAQGNMAFRCTATAFERHDNLLSHTYRFLTASHCAAATNALTASGLLKDTNSQRVWFFITTDDGDDKRFFKAKVVAVGSQNNGDDFAVVEAKMSESLPTIHIGVDSTHLYGEDLFNVSVPLGTGKQVLHGRITEPKINRPVEDEGISWTGDVMVQIPGVNGGSSGSAIVCTTQRAICGVFVGTIGATEGVAIPISRFSTWYAKLNAELKERP